MFNKKAQGMPMNVIIIAIIVLVVLVILIAFFAGGFGSVVGKVRDLFTGTTAGQSRDVVIQTCQNLCDTAKVLPEGSQQFSGFCKQSFVVDDDSNSNTPPKRMACGRDSKDKVLRSDTQIAKSDEAKKVQNPGTGQSYDTLGVDCIDITC
ncbi:hypothetical protein HYU23_03600 [Candidatus Woesearchaeota archaeon]|nr:hypothetical protein [Candidatus Woesearchaeota archaeon]